MKNYENYGDGDGSAGLKCTIEDQSPAGALIESAANKGTSPINTISNQVGQISISYMISNIDIKKNKFTYQQGYCVHQNQLHQNPLSSLHY